MAKSRLVPVRRLLLRIRKMTGVLREDQISIYASQASFFIVISALPFLVILLAASRYIVPVTAEDILRWLRELLPQPGAELLDSIAGELSRRANLSVISISALTAFWSASRGTGAVFRGVSGVFGCGSSSGYFFDKCRYLFYTFAFVAMLLATLLAAVFGSIINSRIVRQYPALSGVISFLLRIRGVLLFLLLALFFALLYRTAARCAGKETAVSRRFSAHLPGALAASGGWILFSYFYSLYMTHFPSASYLYGSLAAVVLMMLWLYICMNILLFGAEINKYLNCFRRPSK